MPECDEPQTVRVFVPRIVKSKEHAKEADIDFIAYRYGGVNRKDVSPKPIE